MNLINWAAERVYSLKEAEKRFFLKSLGARLLSEANDVKRTREALANDIGWSSDKVSDVFNGDATPEDALLLLSEMVKKYPVSLNDLWLDIPLTDGVCLVSSAQSKETSRVFSRLDAQGESTPYYEYRDTAMAPQAPFRPEWILELRHVEDSDPWNPDVVYNKGHLMNQFTFFIGEVNFYYEVDGHRYCCEMNTGDSCHISPFVPHTFASRSKSEKGLIIAVTYGDSIRRSNNHLVLEGQSEAPYLSRIFKECAKKITSYSSFNISLKAHLDADFKTIKQVADETRIEELRVSELLCDAEPSHEELAALAKALKIRPEDLLQKIESKPVEVSYSAECDWQVERKSGSRHQALARTESQPGMKSFSIEVKKPGCNLTQHHAYHEYVYNYGELAVTLHLEEAEKDYIIEPGGSCYIQPFVSHAFSLKDSIDSEEATSHLLIVRLAGSFNQPCINEVSQISPLGRERLIKETTQWF